MSVFGDKKGRICGCDLMVEVEVVVVGIFYRRCNKT